MKKLFALLLVVVMSISLVACGNDTKSKQASESVNTESKEDSETVNTESTTQDNISELCIGTWKWDSENSESNDWGVDTMELFKGGTGKGTNSFIPEEQYYALAWEIKDGILVVSFKADPFSCAFEVEGEQMISTDGKLFYNKE